MGGWVVRYLDKGVAETLADALDGDLCVAVVVAIVVANPDLHKEEIDAGVRKVAVCSFCPDSSTDQLAMVSHSCLSESLNVFQCLSECVSVCQRCLLTSLLWYGEGEV